MYKVNIFSIGKNKKGWQEQGIDELKKRLKGQFQFQWALSKNLSSLERVLSDLPYFICLDEKGSQLTSAEFSQFLFSELEKGGSTIHFVIGGADGLSQSILSKSCFILSLSKSTFPHQIARLLLIEQIYRAAEIRNNSPYHR